MSEEESDAGADAGLEYKDAITGEMRRHRGRLKPRGPWSGAEANMSTAFKRMMAAMHWMHGELSDEVAKEFTAWFAASQVVIERYAYKYVREPTAETLASLLDELSVPHVERTPADDVDVYRDLT